jgi:hypothetical protein
VFLPIAAERELLLQSFAISDFPEQLFATQPAFLSREGVEQVLTKSGPPRRKRTYLMNQSSKNASYDIGHAISLGPRCPFFYESEWRPEASSEGRALSCKNVSKSVKREWNSSFVEKHDDA